MDIRRTENLKKILFAMKYKILTLIALFVFSIVSLIIMQNSLLEKANISGIEMARSYTVEEEKSLRAYTVALRLAGNELDNIIHFNKNHLDTEVSKILQNLKNAFDQTEVFPFAVIYGKLYFIEPELKDLAKDINPRNRDWYKKAINADNEVILSNAYVSYLHQENVITIAKETNIPGTIIAFNIFLKNFSDLTNNSILPQGSHYYLFDKAGNLLYTTSDVLTEEQMNKYIDMLTANIENKTIKKPFLTLLRPDGQKRAVYYSMSTEGWLSIVTLPYNELLKDIYRIGFIALSVIVVFIIISIITTIREFRLNQNINRTTDTIRVLGNSYYAIYRMNFYKNTYEMIKDSDDIRKKLAPKGNYADFLNVISESIEESVKEEFLENFSAQNIKKLVSQRVRDYGGDFKRKFNGEYQWVSIRLLFDESLESDEAVLCYRKIEDEKQLQLQQLDLLRSSLESAQQSEKARNMFFSSMSHDMRTPLNAIIGLSELAKNYINSPEKISEYLGKITVSSKHLLDLINDILEISRLEQGKINIETKQINLKECVEECATLFQSRAAQEGKAFMINFDIQDSVVYGDPFRLSQILNNLISNAFKFTKTNDRIIVKLKQLGKDKHTKYQFEIEDTGVGMSKEFIDRIFIPYERETRFGAKSVSGTGLGTAIVKNIISHLGGEITVSSELGKGSIFTVTLPFEPVKSSEVQENSNQQDTLAPLDPTNVLAGKKILLAEDNMINMEIATELLSMNGIEVVQAWDGVEALRKFKESQENYFDAILMDMQMPNMDGCEASKAIRSLSRSDAKSVPIIAVTANAFAEDFAATSAAGMNAHISKPIDFALLCQTISELTK